jgi:hypothetical protein
MGFSAETPAFRLASWGAGQVAEPSSTATGFACSKGSWGTIFLFLLRILTPGGAPRTIALRDACAGVLGR